jgi:hypothetical protein
MSTPSERAVAARKKLFEDFEWWAKNCWFIRTKEAKITTLVLNRAQRRLLECCYDQLKRRGYIRLVILKGRQIGSSTFVEAFLYWWTSQREAQKALVVAHDKEATKVLFKMTRRGHDKMATALKPSTTASSTTELVFDKLDSEYRIVTAGGDGVVRGDTITAFHLSEVAWWPKGSAMSNYSGLMDAVPTGRAAAGTVGFEESTANGYNMFEEHCTKAIAGESDWELVFLPWWWDTSCEAEPNPGFERSPGEDELATMVLERFGDVLTDANLMFRRLKLAEKGEELFKQEYPSTPEEAFLTSGAPVFNGEVLNQWKTEAVEPIARMTLMPNRKFERNPRGELRCYLPHDPDETYYIGGDVGFGVKKDASVLQVFDSKRRQAACWYSNRIGADWFGTVSAALARFYNDALLAVEANNNGILTNRVIHIDEEYGNVFKSTHYDKITEEETEVVGFITNVKTKPLIVEELRAQVLGKGITVYDPTTIEEMKRFIVTDNGKFEAEAGHHDDHVLALAIANHINAGEWKPIVNEDGWFAIIE